jgi:hypothetical protein
MFNFAQPFLTMSQFTSEWLRLSAASSQLAVASAVTIGHRLPQFVEAAMGFPDAQAEVRRAASEKIAATVEAHMVVGQAMLHASLSMGQPATTAQRLIAMADLTHATMAPVHKRARANARRLTRESLRRKR